MCCALAMRVADVEDEEWFGGALTLNLSKSTSVTSLTSESAVAPLLPRQVSQLKGSSTDAIVHVIVVFVSLLFACTVACHRGVIIVPVLTKAECAALKDGRESPRRAGCYHSGCLR